MTPDDLPPVLQTVLARVVKAERRRAARRAEHARREVYAALGETFVKALPAMIGVKVAQPDPVQAAPVDPVSTLLKSLSPETPADRLRQIAAEEGLGEQLRWVKAHDPAEYAELVAVAADEMSLERLTKADRSHLVRKVIRNRLGRRQVVWVRPEDADEAGETKGQSRGQGDAEGDGPRHMTREQVTESRTLLANAVADPSRLNPEQVRELARHIDAITKDEAKGLLRQLGQKVSGDQMAVARRLLDAVRAGREPGKGVGEGLRRQGVKVSGQYGAWGQAVGGTGGKPEARREDFPKRGVSPEEAMVERARVAKEKELAGKPRPAKKDKPKKNRKRATGETLAAVVQSYGGIDPNSDAFKAHFGSMKEAMEYGFHVGMFRKGGRGLDQLAQEMAGDRHINPQEGEDPVQHLVDKLIAGAASDLYDRQDELQRAEDEYYAAMQEAATEQGVTYEPGLTAEELFGDVPGFAEAYRGAEDDAAEAAASDPYGSGGEGSGSDTSFDFGYNVADGGGVDEAETSDPEPAKTEPLDLSKHKTEASERVNAEREERSKLVTRNKRLNTQLRQAADRLEDARRSITTPTGEKDERFEAEYHRQRKLIDSLSDQQAKVKDRLAEIPEDATLHAAQVFTRMVVEAAPDEYEAGTRLSPDGTKELPHPVKKKPADPTPTAPAAKPAPEPDRAYNRRMRTADRHAAEADRLRGEIDRTQAEYERQQAEMQTRRAAADARVKELEAAAAAAAERAAGAKQRPGDSESAGKPREADKYWASQLESGLWVTPFTNGTYSTRRDAETAARAALNDYAPRKPRQPKPENPRAAELREDINAAANEQRQSGKVAKQATDMTQAEFLQKQGAVYGGGDRAKAAHRRMIEGVLSRGGYVPPEVLADYPDLARPGA